ncbi:hypothetical protein [Metabacillus fastidiosus]|uniref:hypothetical protein n=1 Tax=Metabacillus fastidiosus TaxID=1458 RepID=UPI003D278992
MAVSTYPVISWWNRSNTQQVSLWDVGQGGTVKAGEESPQFGVLIWNNRGGTADVSDIVKAELTTRDMDAKDVTPPVVGKWVRVKNDSQAEVTAERIGKGANKSIKTSGTTTNTDGSFTPGVAPHTSPAGEVSALGVKNDGTKSGAAGNFIELTLSALPEATAPAGTFDFVVRLSYTFT